MSLITALTLAGFTNTAHAESPFIKPVSLADFSEWELNSKTGAVGSVEMEGTIEVPLYTDAKGAPTMKTYMTTDATEEGERGDLVQLLPETSLIVVSEDFAKRNDLEIKVTNKRLIPVPDDFKVGGEIKYVKIPSVNLGGLVLNDVTALIAGSEKKINGSTFQGMTIGLGALPTSYAVLNSKGVIKFSDDGAGLMSEVGAKGVPYKSQTIMVGTIGKKDLFGSKKTLLKANALIVDASFNGSSETVATALTFGKKSSSLDKYVDAPADISSYNADIRQDWLTATIGETSLPATYVNRATYQSFSDGLSTMGRIGNGVLIAYDIVVDKTSETIGMVEHDGFSFTSYYPIHLEEARKALEPKEEATEESAESAEGSDSTDSTSEEAVALNVAGINGLISALEVAGGYTEALEQYALLIADEEEKTDCQLWLNYGHAQRVTGNLDGAHKAYTESARLYHSWWDIDLGRRMDINKAQGDMEESDIEAAKERSSGADINSVEDGWYISQPEACYRSDGFVAAVDMLNGKYDAVESNYRSNLDLDANLAMVFGNSALIQGKTELAHEAFRQAIKLENGALERASGRHALALVYADQGKWEQANALFQESLEILDNPLSAMMWLDNAIAQMGADSALKMVQDWSASHPTRQASRVAELRYWTMLVSSLTPDAPTEGEEAPTVELTEEEQAAFDAKAEQLAAATSSFEAAKQAFEAWSADVDRWNYTSPIAVASSQLLGSAYTGNLEKAGQILDSVKGQVSSDPGLTFAAAQYYALSGDTDKAEAAMSTLAGLDPFFTGSVLVLK